MRVLYIFPSYLLRRVQLVELPNLMITFLLIELLICTIWFYKRQILTSSHDTTIRLWDLAAGRSMATLTNHKKSVRAVVLHPTQ